MRTKIILKQISLILITSMLHLCWLTSYGWAEMAKTNELLGKEPQLQISREMLIDALNRQDVQKELEQYGISKEEAVDRIKSLTDEEVVEIAGKLDELQAAGESLDNINWGGAIVSIIFFLPVVVIDICICFIPTLLRIPCIFKLTRSFLQRNYPEPEAAPDLD